ncbi:MAG: hypothetical protein ABI947_22510 [Chloroflexota bacterium]
MSYKPKAGCVPPTAMSLENLSATAMAGQLLVTPLTQPLAITATGKVRLRIVKHTDGKTLCAHVEQFTQQDSQVYTDERQGYN